MGLFGDYQLVVVTDAAADDDDYDDVRFLGLLVGVILTGAYADVEAVVEDTDACDCELRRSNRCL